MTGKRQHYLSAAVVGGFGQARSQSPTESIVAVRRRDDGRTRISVAGAVAFEKNTYRLANPMPGVDPDVVDKIWQLLEPHLPGAFYGLAENRQTGVDQEVILLYVAACAVRHPEVFTEIANEQQAAAGLPPLQGDLLQIARLQVMENTIFQISGWRWHVFLCPEDAPSWGKAPPLILNDKGFCYLSDDNRPGKGLLVPLNPRVAVFGFAGSPPGFQARRILITSANQWINRALWLEAPREVYSHPTMTTYLRSLDLDVPVNRWGPFRGIAGGGFFA